MEFLAANYRCELEAKLVCSEAEFLAHSQNLKAMNMSRTLLLLASTLVFVSVSRAVGEKSDFEIRLFKLEMASK